MKKVLIILSLILIMFGVGCSALSHYITYAEINHKAVEYVVDAGVADANDYISWWPNMVLAEQLMRDVDDAHLSIQQALEHLMAKDDLTHSRHQGVAVSNYSEAQQREETWFGEKGLASMGLGLLGFGGFTGLLGLMRKRPGDITPPEMKQALASATNKTSAELSAKSKQFIQLVKGVQVFMNEYKNTSDNKEAVILKALKTALDTHQDIDTKAAVAVVKKTS